MPLFSEKYGPPYPMHAEELRSYLGFPGRLPENEQTYRTWVQGYRVVILSREDAAERSGHSNKPHRVLAQCKMCGTLYPFGRLLQHERACKAR